MPDVRAFQDLVKKGDLDAVRSALSVNPGLLDAVNEAGQGAFLLAKYYRQDAVADYLLKQGAKLNFFDECVAGETASVMAQIDAMPALLEAHSTDGWTPLHLAAFFGSKELAQALLAKGAKIDSRSTNNMQNTPLHAAVAGRRLELLRFLLEHGADANARQTGGWTALQGAAQAGDRELVETLIAHGAQIEARSDNNQCALDMALMRGHHEIAALLEGLGAKL
jgi:ankyrin repeat protein